MKEKLKKLELRLTELANYLDISRPTLYKYIENYQKRNYRTIDSMTLEVLRFIKQRTTVSKLQVINFIIQAQKNKQGMPRELIDKIDHIVINENRGDELVELVKLFDIKDSEKIIEEIIKKHVRGDKE